MVNFAAIALRFGPALGVLIVGAILIKGLQKVIKKILEKTGVDPMLHKFIINAAKIAGWSVLIVSVLKMIGVDTTSVITVFAACGAAVALALQGCLSNLASGILIMITTPFKKGDYITCAGNAGSVDSINLLHTSIITVDNQHISIPNAVLTGNAITNATKLQTRRVDIRIGIAYESDIELAKKAILDMADKTGSFLEKPAALVNVVEYADSAIILEFRGWCSTSDYWSNYFTMQNGMKAALDAAGIEIPFTQIDIHTK
ncbi:MAG: mechanosensitive ion channel family protein [Clostridia bacterium]|nr:mechanosensitive ion channel family protein [Clostridia bacterium]